MSSSTGRTANELAHISVHESPDFAWSFEQTDAFSFRIVNHGLRELSDPAGAAKIRYHADVLHAGNFVRRIASVPFPGVVPVGETRVFGARLGVTMIGGDYELRFGLERNGADGTAEPIAVGPRGDPIRRCLP